MESDPTPLDPSTAAAQLAGLRSDRVQLAARVVPPWWYDPCLGLVVFVLVSAMSLRYDGWWYFAALGVGFVGLWVLVAAYKRITGLWVNGFRPGRTRRVVYVWVPGYLAVVVAALVADQEFGVRWAMPAAGAVLGIALTFLSRWWTRVYVAELRDEL
jgi:hypothetical protein